MFFPYFDENPKQRIPYITYCFIALNTLLFFLLNFRPDFKEIVFHFGFTPDQFSPVTLVTSMFLHGSFSHLLGNMWFLWLFGDNIEDKIGSVCFIVFYLTGGIFADLTHTMLSSEAMRVIPCIGASGAISAIMGAYFMIFPRAKIRNIFFVYFRPIRMKISAYTFLGIWALWQLILGAISSSNSQVTSVAYGAHIGGFFFGILVGVLIRGLLSKSDTFLMPQELKEQEEAKEFDHIIQKAVEAKKEKAKSFYDFEKEIVKFLEQGDIECAIDSYTLFESHSIPGALKPKYQRQIAELLSAREQDLLALQAYLRLIAQYRDHRCSASALCRIGLLYSRKFKNTAEGFTYLTQGLKRSEEISDQALVDETQKEMTKISKVLYATILDLPHQKGQFCVIAQLFDEALWNIDKITKVLRSAGIKNGQNRGMKLAYNADYNLKKKDGIILQRISKEEALEAVKLIQSIGIPVIAVPQESVLEYPLIHSIRKVTLRKDRILFLGENAKTYDLPIRDIVYVCLATLPYFTYGRIEDASQEDALSKVFDIFAAKELAGTWTLLARHDSSKEGIKDLKFNHILDVFTGSGLRLRVNNLNFTYEAADKLKNDNDFAFMVEDIASIAGGGKIDENIKLFISTSKWTNTCYRNVQELNHKGLWKMRLHLIYEQLLSSFS